MYLKSLELNGFKSFPDKIELEFDKGLTCVVGPNGSGKSNIGDAVRWVLGEQSSKSLRGSNMQDIIFSGTQKRKAGKFAQVTLNIENSDRALSVDNDLVSVSRKLYQNGDSEYIINGEQVRLKDVLELFMDTGLGRDGYSIIGQGKIADIVSSKSTERREIFEEAAGVSKFRYKKSESERKLARAEENILRLRDILTELETRVGPLKTQSEKAKKYLELRDRKKDLDVSVSVYRLSDLEAKLDGLEDKLLTAQGEYEALSREIDEAESAADESNLTRARLSDEIDQLREKVRQAEQLTGELQSKIAVCENDITHIESAIADDELKIKEIDLSKDGFAGAIEKKESELKLVREKIEKAKLEESEIEKALEGAQTKATQADKDIRESAESINALYIKKSELQFTVSKESSDSEDFKSRIEKEHASLKDAEAEGEKLSAELKDIRKACEAADEKISEYENRLSGFTKLYESKKAQLDKKTDEQNAAILNLGQLKNRVAILGDLERSMEGFSHSVKKIIKARDEGRISGIYGTVAQLINVDKKYSLAIETALGAAMQNVVVQNEETAKRCIRFLKEINGGRATFLPITTIKPRELSKGQLSGEGYIDTASNLVSCDSKYKDIVSNLLGRIVVAEDLDSAGIISKKNNYSFKTVTLDGQVINAGGSFTGGSASRSAGLLTRKNEIDSINAEIAKLEESRNTAQSQLETLKAEVTKLSLNIEGEKEQANIYKADKVRFEAELKRLSDLTAQNDMHIDLLESNIRDFETRIKNAGTARENAEADLERYADLIKEAENAAEQNKSELSKLRTEREELSAALSDKRIEAISLTRDEQSVLDDIERIKSAAEDSNDAKIKLDLKIMRQKEEIAAKNDEIKLIRTEIESNLTNIKTLNSNAEDSKAEFKSLEEKAEGLRAKQKIKMQERENVSRELERSGEKKINVSGDIDKILTSLYEEYELTRSEAASLAKPLEDPAQAVKEANSLKNKIRALGSVNVNAIEEYKEVSERYEYLSAQLGDVLKSKAELEKLIADLTEEMIAIFSDSFKRINDNFKQIFSELFGGGSGELVMTDPENVLESGIEIKVAPPGKVIKNLLSLSGGEQAFVAIAIYFSILKVKPSPFCILDEIEAALDDVNVTKYAQYLRNFTDKTQFILVSHRRGTMEESDVLYGVTMQEKGVSKLLRLDAGQTHMDFDKE